MPTTFVNTIDETEILAKRTQCDYAGNDIQTTYATKSELPTATSDLTNDSGFITLSDVPAQVNADWAASSGVAEILNKPTIPTATSDLTNDSGFLTSSDVPVKDVQVGGTSVVNAQGVAEISIPPTGVLDVEVDGSSVVNSQGVAEITLPTFTQVNADWDASSGVAEILHKPDLSIYAESSDLATVATTGSYDDLLDKPTIPAAQINSDWNATSGIQEILNKPTLAAVATSGAYADLSGTPTLATVATSGSYADLLDKPSIPAAQINSDWDATSGVQEILNKPNLSTVATTGQYADLLDKPDIPASTSELVNNSGFITLSDVPTQVNADWDSNSGASEILNKPDLSIYAESSDLATVATSGSYNDLLDKPSIPSAQVNADWSATSGVAQILNKPSIPTATSDLTNDSGFITLSDVPAQANADWDATSGVSEILNKPTIPSGTQLVPAATSADADKVLTVNAQGTPAWATAQAPISAGDGISITNNIVSTKVDGTTIDTNSSGELTVIGGGGSTQVNSDWDATSGVAEILNKPVPKTLVAGTGITITENSSELVVASTNQLYSAGNGLTLNNATFAIDPTVVATQSDLNRFNETVLYNNTSGQTGDFTLSESVANFDTIKIIYSPSNAASGEDTFNYGKLVGFFDGQNMADCKKISLTGMRPYGNVNGSLAIRTKIFTIDSTGTVFTSGSSYEVYFDGSAWYPGPAVIYVYKIIGLNRISSN